jgi:hypothetical protein
MSRIDELNHETVSNSLVIVLSFVTVHFYAKKHTQETVPAGNDFAFVFFVFALCWSACDNSHDTQLKLNTNMSSKRSAIGRRKEKHRQEREENAQFLSIIKPAFATSSTQTHTHKHTYIHTHKVDYLWDE